MKAADLIEFYTHSVLGRQTRVATFNPTCLSKLTATVGLLALSFHFSTTLWNIFLRIRYMISRYS